MLRALHWCVGSSVLLACSEVQELPANQVLPSPPRHATGLVCQHLNDAAASPERSPSPLAFDARLSGWHVEGPAFATGQPLTLSSVRAEEVRPHWSDSQRAHVDKATQRASRRADLVPIGGDYWRSTPYEIVPAGSGSWISSNFAATDDRKANVRRDESLTGSLWKDFVPATEYLHIAVGGDSDASVGVELLVEPGSDVSACARAAGASTRGSLLPLPGSYGRYDVAAVFRGSDQDGVVSHDLDIDQPGCRIKGRHAIVRVFDTSRRYHVNVGQIELTSQRLDLAETPLWGFADFHTHPTSYLSFGGLQGIHTVWGVPGGAIDDYLGPANRWKIARDIPACDDPHKVYNAHHGGYAAPVMLNFAEHRTSESLDDLATPSISNLHGSQGAPSYRDFPNHESGAHQEYHITQIYRAYLGGLRLMTALALHNQGLEYGVGWVNCSKDGDPTVDTTTDMDVIRAHVEAMRELADLNQDWMGIAYTPAQARALVRQNKLAVVLGVEVPQLGENDGVAAQVKELDDLGIRQVIVVHGMDNLLGGTALFQDLYNTVNDWMHRNPRQRDHVEELSGKISLDPMDHTKSVFFQVTTSESPLRQRRGTDFVPEPIEFRLGNPRRIVLSDMFPHPGGFTYSATILGMPLSYGMLHPLVTDTPLFKYEQGPYDGQARGHRNVRGLTGRGQEFIELMMKRGMLVDIAHMSDQTVKDTFDHVDAIDCHDYPLMVSHTHFRRLAIKQDYSDRLDDFLGRTGTWVHDDLTSKNPAVRAEVMPMTACVQDHRRCDPRILEEAYRTRVQSPFTGSGTIDRGNLAREYDISTAEAYEVQRRHGVLGVFLGHSAIDGEAAFAPPDGAGALSLAPPDGASAPAPFATDCAGTSKSFAAALLFAQRRFGGLGVASDFAMISNVTPRFGPDACGAYIDIGNGSESAAQLLETLMEPDKYRFDAQRDPILYSSGPVSCASDDPNHHQLGQVPCGDNAPLEPYVMGERTLDFNVDGLANFGLVPDMLQDTANVVRNTAAAGELDPLFQSAEAYVHMWERARAVAGCGKNCDDHPMNAPPKRRACGNACPKSWNGGAPMQSVGGFFVTCEVGKRIGIPNVFTGGAPFPNPIYQQSRANPQDPGELTQQGDWALFAIGEHPTWTCGNSKPQPMACPSSANYVQVRRVLDTTVGPLWERDCNRQPLPPENGNRSVLFECLVGPHLDEATPERP